MVHCEIRWAIRALVGDVGDVGDGSGLPATGGVGFEDAADFVPDAAEDDESLGFGADGASADSPLARGPAFAPLAGHKRQRSRLVNQNRLPTV